MNRAVRLALIAVTLYTVLWLNALMLSAAVGVAVEGECWSYPPFQLLGGMALFTLILDIAAFMGYVVDRLLGLDNA